MKKLDVRVSVGIGAFFVLILGIILQKDVIVSVGVVCVAIFIMWAIMYSMITHTRMLKKRCTQTIMAKCIGMQSQRDQDGLTYAPVYEIQYKGETLTLVSYLYTSNCDVKTGQVREIKIDPEDPHYFVEKRRKVLDLPGKIVLIVFIIIWIIGCLQAIF